MNVNPHVSGQSLHAGDKLDKYDIVSQIGAGGMSVVWKGHDRLLDRYVAIKHLQFQVDSDAEERQELFLREAQLQKRVSTNQKYLVKVIDFIAEARGLFIVLEYVKGQSLDQLLAQSPAPMDERQVLGIIGGAALGLDAIHKQNIIHRDLKPSNILLPAEGGLKICDFGLATLMEDQEALDVGSVRYMAPELFGDEKADQRADIYALGLMAYEMLAGRDKFADVFKIVLRDQRNQALRWMKWHTNMRVKAPPLSQVNPKIPAALSDLVSRMMEKDPEQRVASAGELLDAIRRHFSGQGDAPAAAPHAADAAPIMTTPVDPTAPLPKKNKLPIYLAAMLGVWLAVGAGFYLYRQGQEQQRVEDVRNAAIDQFEQGREHYHAGNFALARETFEQLAADWPDDLTLGKGSRARALLSEAMLLKEEGRYEEALAKLDETDKLNVIDSDTLKHEREILYRGTSFLDAVNNLQELINTGRFAEARRRIGQLRTLSLKPEETARLSQIATLLEDQDARAQIQRALNEAQRLREANRPNEAITVLNDAISRHNNSRELNELLSSIEEEERYKKAVVDATKAESTGDFNRAIAAWNAVLKLRPDGETEQKIKTLRGEQALEQGLRLMERGNRDAAAKAFNRALSFMESPEAQRHLATIESLDQKAAFVRAGDQASSAKNYETAISHYGKALELGADPEISRKVRSATVQLKLEQGQRALKTGDTKTATSLFQEAEQLDSGNREAQTALAQIQRIDEYRKHLAAGDAARQQSKFAEATLNYRRARDVMQTDEIQERLDNTEYDKIIATIKADIAAENWASAKAWLRTVKATRDNEEIRKLLAEVEKHVPRIEEEE